MHISKRLRLSATGVAAAALIAACGGNSTKDPVDPKQSTVTIKRDSYGTPRIYADDTYSLFFGLGYAVAEDRLFQWEMIKRMARGTLAEVLGPSHVAADTAARRAYDSRDLQRQIDALPEGRIAILQGWADGYNKRLDDVLANRATLLSKQFKDAGIEPTPITPLDIMGAYFRGSLANFGDSSSEVLNLGLLDALRKQHGDDTGRAIFDQLRWKNDPTSPTTIEETWAVAATKEKTTKLLASATETARRWLKLETSPARQAMGSLTLASSRLLTSVSDDVVKQLMSEEREKYGGTGPDYYPRASNTWSLAADRIAEGRAAFYAGPQFGNNSPTNAFGFGLHGAGYNALGSSHWGFPMVMWGANDRIGWGVTVGFGDSVDIFQLTLNPNNSMQYRHNGAWRDLTKRVETIKVKGAADVNVEFLVSHYGQLDSVDETNKVAYARARTWAGREVDTLIAWSEMNKATNWQEYLEYGKRIAASVNWFYVDKDNNIGTAYLGSFVRRSPAHDFRLPLPGDGSADWLGSLPFADQPRILNPKSGEIVNWNNKVSKEWNNADDQYWGHAHHVDLIKTVVGRNPKISLDEFKQINTKTSLTEPNFSYFKPFLVDAVSGLPASDARRQAIGALATWDGSMKPDAGNTKYESPSYTLFREWLPRMLEATLKDDIPEQYWAQYRGASTGSVSIGVNVTLNALLGDRSGVIQKFDFFNGTNKNDVILSTLQAAIESLTARYGSDMSGWLTNLTPHSFSIRSLGSFDVNTPDQALSLPVNMNRGTSNHMVSFQGGKLEYADVIPPGQSGFISQEGVASKNYQDQLQMYGEFKLKSGWLDVNESPTPVVNSVTLTVNRK